MEQHDQQKLLIPGRDVLDGLLFIPDISGFTEFVHSTDVLTGRQIIYELLSAVISQNNLQLNIAEVEGDAVLFYRYGAAPSLYELIRQYERMVTAFENKRRELQDIFLQPLDLSLKIIAHYGPMTEYTIGPFRKLYGQVVVEAHSLLKNSIASDSYLLLTDSLLEMAAAADDEPGQHSILSNTVCEADGSLRNICFTYVGFRGEEALKQVA